MAHITTTTNSRRQSLIMVIRDQLPRMLQDSLAIDVQSDPFRLRSKAIFKDAQGRSWETELEPLDIQGIPVPAKIPESFLSMLCVVG